MLHISLSDFARSGTFGTIRANTPRSEVREILGEPSDWGFPPNTIDTAEIWKYGDIEIHFFDDAVWVVFTDWFDVPQGGDSFELDPWVLRAGLGRDEFQAALRESDISYTSKPNRHNEDETDVITAGGVCFTFRERDNEYGAAGLCAFHTDSADA